MEKEVYFKVTNLENENSFISSPTIILKLKEGKLESITSTQEILNKIKFIQKEDGKYSVNSGYDLKMISEETAKKEIKARELNWIISQDHFLNIGQGYTLL